VPGNHEIIGRRSSEVNARLATCRRLAFVAVVVLTTMLSSSGCGGQEARAEKLYREAQQHVDKGEVEQAATALRTIVDLYPTTDAGRRAAKEVVLYDGLSEAELLWPVRRARDLMVRTARAIQSYRGRHRRWPESLDDLRPRLLDELPIDPWGRPLDYRQKSRGRGYVLSCLGSDGREGGIGEARDLFVEDGSFVHRPSGGGR